MEYRYFTFKSGIIYRLPDGAHIPPDPANCDYTKYLAWVAGGNVAPPISSPSDAK
jgi:hypothetical protein